MKSLVVPALTANWLLWLARIASLASLLVLSAFLVGEGFPLAKLTTREAALFLCFPLGVLLGLAWAWWQPRVGGAIALGSLVGFYALHLATAGRFPSGPWFIIFTSPALLFLVASCPTHQPLRTP